MNNDMFEELLQSVKEGGAILRGEAAPARAYSVADPDVAEVREIYGLSQSKFASLLGISVRTLQNWEQRRRKPEGPARVLLRVAARHPEAVLDVVKEESKRKLRPVATKTGAARSKKPAKTLVARRPTKSTHRAK